MLTFKKAELDDAELLASAISTYGGRICDYSLGNIIFWRNYYDIAFSLDEDGLVLRYGNMGKRVCCSFPVSKNPKKMIDKLLDTLGKPLCLTCLTEEQLAFVSKSYTVRDVINSRDWDDYLYAAEDLISLAGRRFCGQRNHINKFKKSYPDSSFEVISAENVAETKDFCHRYFCGGIGKATDVSEIEYAQLIEQLDNWDK